MKRLVLSAVIAGSLGLGFFATSSFASGPLVIGPSPAPVTAPTVTTVPLKMKVLATYRQVRAFWLSRAIVR